MNLHDLHIQTSGISLSFSTTPKPRWPIWKHPTLPQPSPKPKAGLPVRKPLCQAVARASSSTAFKRLQVTYCTWKTVACFFFFFSFRSKFRRRNRVFVHQKKRTHTHTQCAQRHRFLLTPSTSVDPLWSLLLALEQWNMLPGKPQNNSSPPETRMEWSGLFVQFKVASLRWLDVGFAASVWDSKAESLGQQNVADKISSFLLI